MHKVIVAQFVSLDGVTDDPDGSSGTAHGGWAFRYGPGPVSGDKFDLGAVLDTGVKLLGRTAWELFAGLFPTRDDDFSRRLTAMDKLVASRSLTDVDRWANSTLLDGDLVDTVRTRARHQDVLVTGSGSVVDQLVARDMVDEFRLLVFPLVLGTGRRVFDGATAALDLELVSSMDAGGGVLRQVYERKGGPLRYALLIHERPGAYDGFDDAARAAITAEYTALRDDDERVRSGERLRPASTATTVRAGGMLTDGPFAETKEVFGGFYLVEAPDLDSALELAGRVPAVRLGGSVEVRPLAEP